jgi:hypothetical protein
METAGELIAQINALQACMAHCYSDEAYRIYQRRLDEAQERLREIREPKERKPQGGERHLEI